MLIDIRTVDRADRNVSVITQPCLVLLVESASCLEYERTVIRSTGVHCMHMSIDTLRVESARRLNI